MNITQKEKAIIMMVARHADKRNRADKMLLSDTNKGGLYHKPYVRSSNDLFRYVLMYDCIPTLSIR